ncbi:MAG: alpha-glucosidase C-terminal domain-containing protein [Fodinibius sp.]|nr:alpha-glucosidase C-terminal domain-containing protein [Fodinibius sp.]
MVENSRNVWAFSRFLNDRMFVITVINRSQKSRRITIPLKSFEVREGNYLKNLITGNGVKVKDGELELVLPPLSGAILSPEEE